ncbi:Importin subunit alpha-1a [Glycine soja]|uniref:Importin subunit alpha n=1 Tax=Glycine soja TaxID=3848 RepID=A0A0B2QBN5_GLYSO|nr:Importin subunit alpha-1a [Glycine soja]
MSLQPGSGSGSDSGSGSEKRKKSYDSEINLVDDTPLKKGRREELSSEIPSKEKLLEAIPEMKQRIWSECPDEQMDAMMHFTNLLGSIEPPRPIDEVIEAEVVPRFVQFLDMYDKPDLQFEAVWSLTNIASGKSHHTRVVVEHGAVPLLVKLLILSNNEDVIEQVVWAISNIAGESPKYRDLVLEEGVLLPLISLLGPPLPTMSMLLTTTWTLSNLVRGKPHVQFKQVEPLMPVLKTLIDMDNEEVLLNACSALYFLSNVSAGATQAIIEAEVCPKLVELLLYSSDSVSLLALQTLGNIAAGNDAQTQHVIDNQFLPPVRLLLFLTRERNEIIFRKACWAISNITAGNRTQIQAVIDAEIFPILVGFFCHHHADSDFDIKKEVVWAITNATRRGSADQIMDLADQGCAKPLSELLTHPNPEIVAMTRRREINERAVRIFKTLNFWAENDLEDHMKLQDLGIW